jgi:hypothetical protein
VLRKKVGSDFAPAQSVSLKIRVNARFAHSMLPANETQQVGDTMMDFKAPSKRVWEVG